MSLKKSRIFDWKRQVRYRWKDDFPLGNLLDDPELKRDFQRFAEAPPDVVD